VYQVISGKKYITFSFDDGTTQDIRLVELLNKYNIKATFNINSQLLGMSGEVIREGKSIPHDKVPADSVRSIYQGHEIAAHTLTHPLLTALEDKEIVRQVEQDRLYLSELAGYEVLGMAYPCGGINYDKRVANLVKTQTGIRYSRTIECNEAFAPQTDLYTFHPTVHHNSWNAMEKLSEQFFNTQSDNPQIFYIWGHSFEFDVQNTWNRFENFLKQIANKPDVVYATNRDVLLNNINDESRTISH
jgi:peptidoglycan-N-acetylglucosamine deacetylase